MFSKMILDDFRIFKNQTIHIGNTITAIAGQNATGKSTILGILGNACELKSKFGTTIGHADEKLDCVMPNML